MADNGTTEEKRLEIFQIRVAPRLIEEIKNLPKLQKAELNEEIILVIKKKAHMNNFDPDQY